MSTFPRAMAAWLIGLLAPVVIRADDLPPGAAARLGSSRLRHGCLALAWAPDGNTFATAAGDGSIRVWDAADGTRLHDFKTQCATIQAILFDPAGKRLLVNEMGGAVHVVDAATGTESQVFRSSTPLPVAALAWRPDGDVATLSERGVYRIWDPKTGAMKRQLGDESKPAAFTVAALAADGTRYAVWAKEKGLLTAWDADGKELFHGRPNVPSVNGLVFSADGKTLAVGSPPDHIAFWDIGAGKELRRIDGVFCVWWSLAFSANGKYLVGRGAPAMDTVHVWGAASGKDLRGFDLVGGPVGRWGQTAVLSPDGKRLIAAQGRAIHIWDVETSAELPGFVGHNAPVVGVCFSADGRSVFTQGQDGAVGQWDAATGERMAWRLRPEEGLFLPAPTADGKIGVFWRQGGWFRWGPDDKSDKAPSFTGVTTVPPYFSPAADGKTIAYNPRDLFVHVRDVETGKDVTKVKLDKPIYSTYALSPDGRFLAVASNDAPTRLYDAATGAEIRSFGTDPATPGAPARPAQGATTLLFTPDGRTLAGVLGKDLTFWETATGRERLHVACPGAPAGRLAFSPDGRLLAAATPGGSAALLDATNGKELTQLPSDLGGVRSLAFSPDGKALAAGGEDGSALIWDIKEYIKGKQAAEVPAERLRALCRDLQDGDAARAYQAIVALAASPKTAAPLLKERLAKGPDESRFIRLIKDLDDDSFDARENAEKELEASGLAALPAVRRALDAQPSAEARQRLQKVLDRSKGVVLVAEEVWDLRALEALERSGAPEAADALRALAKDADKEIVKKEAAAGLDRLERRTGGN